MLLAELAFNVTRALRSLRAPIIALLAIELFDELVFGALEAAWPALREELDLSYAQIGVLLSVPMYSSSLLEPCSVSSATAAGGDRSERGPIRDRRARSGCSSPDP